MGWGIDHSSWHHSITNKQQTTQNKFNTKKIDSFWTKVFVYVFIIGCIGYVIGAGFGSSVVAHETIGSTIVFIIVMGIAPFILKRFLSIYGFFGLLFGLGVASFMGFRGAALGVIEILFHPAVAFSFLGATCGAILGVIIGVIVEGIKASKRK